MEHRKHPRISTKSLEIDISDGKGFFSGSVNNISRFGLLVSDLPLKLKSDADIFTAIINSQKGNFKMFLKPMWENEDGLRKTVGLEIESCSWGWTEFVMDLEPNEGDIWSNTIH